MILWNDTIAMGDTILSFPGTLEHLKRNPQFTQIYWSNSAVGELFPHAKYNVERVYKQPENDYEKISIHEMVHKGQKNTCHLDHLITHFLAYLGYSELSRYPIDPEINVSEDLTVPSYDFLIAPYVLADFARFWPLDNWRKVIQEVQSRIPSATFGILGSKKLFDDSALAKITPGGTQHFYVDFNRQHHSNYPIHGAGIFEEFDKPLTYVVNLMRRTKRAVLTVDTGPSRLMQAVKSVPHLILAHNSVGYDWCTYPGATLIHANMATLGSEQVVKTLFEILK